MGWLSDKTVVVARQDIGGGKQDFVAKGSVGQVVRGNDSLWASLRRRKAEAAFTERNGRMVVVEVDDSEVDQVGNEDS